jgi:hypothetical protein
MPLEASGNPLSFRVQLGLGGKPAVSAALCHLAPIFHCIGNTTSSSAALYSFASIGTPDGVVVNMPYSVSSTGWRDLTQLASRTGPFRTRAYRHSGRMYRRPACRHLEIVCGQGAGRRLADCDRAGSACRMAMTPDRALLLARLLSASREAIGVALAAGSPGRSEAVGFSAHSLPNVNLFRGIQDATDGILVG